MSRGRRISRRERTEPDPLTPARRRDFRAASTFQSPWVILAWWDADFHRWLAAEVRDGQFTAQVDAVRAPETLAAISLAAFAALAVSGYRDHRRRALERALAPVDAALDELEGV